MKTKITLQSWSEYGSRFGPQDPHSVLNFLVHKQSFTMWVLFLRRVLNLVYGQKQNVRFKRLTNYETKCRTLWKLRFVLCVKEYFSDNSTHIQPHMVLLWKNCFILNSCSGHNSTFLSRVLQRICMCKVTDKTQVRRHVQGSISKQRCWIITFFWNKWNNWV